LTSSELAGSGCSAVSLQALITRRREQTTINERRDRGLPVREENALKIMIADYIISQEWRSNRAMVLSLPGSGTVFPPPQQ
jgi:hypothetical protein